MTIEEIDVLQDAVDALERKEMIDHQMGSTMKNAILDLMKNEDSEDVVRFREEKRLEMQQEKETIEKKQRVFKDRLCLIKAKLIHLKDQYAIDGLTSGK